MIRSLKKITIVLCTVIFVFAVSGMPAFAANVLEKANAAGPLQVLYDFMLAISVPMAAVGIAMCAFSFFLPGDKGWETAKSRMLHIGIAIAAIFLIPAVMRFTAGGASVNGWQPDSGREQIVPNQSESIDLGSMEITPDEE